MLKAQEIWPEVSRWGMALAIALAVMMLLFYSFARADETSPAPPVPMIGPIYETSSSWSFVDDQLVFYQYNLNTDGNRYLKWLDYDWIVSQSKITIFNPDPNGISLSSSRIQADADGKPRKDKAIMEELWNRAEGNPVVKARVNVPNWSLYAGTAQADDAEPGWLNFGRRHRRGRTKANA